MTRPWRRRSFALLALALLALGGFWGELVLLRERTPRIATPGSVASLEQVRLGTSDQWLLARGHDRSKPVLLFLHGGPGMPAMFLAHAFQRGLERDFVVVHWDRRGAGKSFEPALDGESLTVQRTLADTFELSRLLLKRFEQARILLVGHSWGSYLGLLAVQRHPEYYSAFIGTGQLAGSRDQVRAVRREFVARMANQAGDRELGRLLTSGDREVNEDDLFRYGGELAGARSFWPILWTGLRAPEYTLWDALNVKKGADLVDREMTYDVHPKPLEGEIGAVAVPVFFFLGRHDYNTPSLLAAQYLERLDSPLKQLVWFERSAHFPFYEEPDRFHSEALRVEGSVRVFWSRRSPVGLRSAPQ